MKKILSDECWRYISHSCQNIYQTNVNSAFYVIFTYLCEIHAFIHFIFQRKCIIKQVFDCRSLIYIFFQLFCLYIFPLLYTFDFSFVNICDFILMYLHMRGFTNLKERNDRIKFTKQIKNKTNAFPLFTQSLKSL